MIEEQSFKPFKIEFYTVMLFNHQTQEYQESNLSYWGKMLFLITFPSIFEVKLVQ